jgi:hypothetical protein
MKHISRILPVNRLSHAIGLLHPRRDVPLVVPRAESNVVSQLGHPIRAMLAETAN